MKFLVWGYYGYKNTGDEMMLSVIVNYLRRTFKGCFIKVRTETPIETGKRHNVETIFETVTRKNSFGETINIFKAITETDIFLMGGGTIIHEENKSSWRALFYFTKLALLAKCFRKKFVFFGIGIGKIDTRFGKFFTKCLLSLSDLTVLRDKCSNDILINLGCRVDKIKVTADLGFLVNKIRKKGNTVANGEAGFKIGVSVLPFYAITRHDAGKNEDAARLIAGALEELAGYCKAEIYFIPMQESSQVSDRGYAKLVAGHINKNIKIHLLEYTDNIFQVEEWFSLMDMVIGMRYHSIVLSFINKIPVVAISYNPKVAGIMREADLEKQCIDIADLSIRGIVAAAKTAYAVKEQYKIDMAGRLASLEDTAERSFSYLRELTEKQ